MRGSVIVESTIEKLCNAHVLSPPSYCHILSPSLRVEMAESNNQEALVSGQGNLPLSRPAHALLGNNVVDEIQANRKRGLMDDEAKQRLEQCGRNELDSGGGVQPVRILVRQVANAMILVMSTTPRFTRE